ncbi:MAG: GNAT family N-acetyltransferase [Maricaulaceae bacterium]
MTTPPRLETERLILRGFEPERDFAPFCEMMGDEETAHFIGGVMEPAVVWRMMAAMIGHWTIRGYSFFVVEEKASGDFAGRVGPWYPEGWLQPEVGWGIVRSKWGKGYAVEAATACLDWVFDELGWDEVVHLIDPANANSQSVAKKLGSRVTGRFENLRPWGIDTDVWSQTAADWRARRAG